MKSFLLVQDGLSIPYQTGERFCEYFITSWLRPNRGTMKSHEACALSSRRWWKAGMQGSAGGWTCVVVKECCSSGTKMGHLWSWGEGVMENRAESPHPSGHRDTLHVLRVSCMLMFGSPHILYYSWLEAIAIWLKKTLWMNPALVYTLWIAVPLYCLHLSNRDLNEANVFCMLEWHVLMETVNGHVGSSGGIGTLARHWRNIRWYHVSRATGFLNHYSKPSQYQLHLVILWFWGKICA